MRELLELHTSLPFQFEYKFFVGLSDNDSVNRRLEIEADKHGDMVILTDFEDNYYKLTLKIAAMLNYALEQTRASLVLKCDDDSFVRLEMFISSIMTHYSLHTKCPPLHRQTNNSELLCIWKPRPLIMGRFSYYIQASSPFGRPEINISDRLPLTESVKGFNPRAPCGAAYMLSRPLVKAIVSGISNNQFRFLQAEDLSVGVWVHRLFVTKHFICGIDYITTFGDLIINDRNVACKPYTLALHYITPNRMMCLWSKLSDSMTASILKLRDGQHNATLPQTLNELTNWCC